jgi:hypothetical protein
MNNSDTKLATPPQTSAGQDLLALLRYWLRGRSGWLVLGLLAAAAGLWLGWPNLVAAGVAPLLLGVLPCVAMCALGLCMKGGSQSCDSKPSTGTDIGAPAETGRQIQSIERQETDR